MADMAKIGIDIGSATIKIVELLPSGKDRWKLLSAATMPAAAGGVIGNQNNLPALSVALAKMLKEAGVKTHRVVAALPEEQISSHVVEMPVMSEEEIQQALQWQVEQYIPIPADKAVWSHQVIKKDQVAGGMEILLVAAAKNLVNAYTQVLEQAGLEVVALETELMALARAVAAENIPLSMVVDIGAKGTDIGIVRNGTLVFARTVPTAGESLTRAIETTLNLDTAQAEQYKTTYGFSEGKLGGKLVDAMKPVLTVLANEIKKTGDFYVSKHPGEVAKVVVLSGGIATLPDIVGNLSGMVGIEVAVANPFARVQLDAGQAKALANLGPFYSVAAGLAMREI